MLALTIIGSIIAYLLIGLVMSGFIRSESEDSKDGREAAAVFVFLWPLALIIVLGAGISNLSKAGFDRLKKNKLPKAQKKKEDLKKVRIQLEETKKEMLEEQRIIAELEEELKEYNNGTRQAK